MSDNQDDAPDIPPALSPEEWKEGGRERKHFWVRLAGDKYTHLRIGGDARNQYWSAADTDDVAAIVALGNEVLRRMDDPRAITNETVRLLRVAAAQLDEHCPDPDQPLPVGFIDTEALIAHNNRLGLTYSLLHELADALESYLPPEPK